MTCNFCGERFNAAGWLPGKRFVCEECEGEDVPGEKTDPALTSEAVARTIGDVVTEFQNWLQERDLSGILTATKVSLHECEAILRGIEP